jgi:hypothetical protein
VRACTLCYYGVSPWFYMYGGMMLFELTIDVFVV